MTLPGARLPRLGMGCMRLSTAPGRDEASGIAVIHAALDAGVRLFDTADAYAHDASDIGHNERLLARALDSWSGDRRDVVVATKGGMTRPSGLWVPDGRARHLAAACHASRTALGVARIQLYQLHAIDPRTPLATSVRALDELRRDGFIEHIGLCNVTVGQIDEARAIAPIASVQVELGVWNDAAILGGVVDYCQTHAIALLAHRPLGGERRRARLEREPVLREIAARHGATPAEIALALLFDRSPLIVPLPGATRPETARSIGRAAALVLDDEDRSRLAARFPAWRIWRDGLQPATDQCGEVLLIMGLAGAGKTTMAQRFVDAGYRRLNRDEAGGGLRDLVPKLEQALASDPGPIVLDNTFVSRTSRAPIVDAARRHGRPVRALSLATSIEEAQINVVFRMLARHGALLAEDALRRAARADPGVFAPGAQFRMQRAMEPPVLAEGFSQIEQVAFERTYSPEHVNRALIVWCDGILMRSRSGARTPTSADDVAVIDGGGDVLRRFRDEGWRLVGLSWQPEIAAGERTPGDVAAIVGRMQALLDIEVDVVWCPHAAGPPVCWCRKPLPGLGVLAIARYSLDPRRCLFVGSGTLDPGFARRLGFDYRDAADVFPAGARTGGVPE